MERPILAQHIGCHRPLMVICTGPETQQDLEFGQPGWTNLCNVWQLSDFSSSHRVLQIPVVYHLPHQADHVRLHVSTNPFDASQKNLGSALCWLQLGSEHQIGVHLTKDAIKATVDERHVRNPLIFHYDIAVSICINLYRFIH